MGEAGYVGVSCTCGVACSECLWQYIQHHVATTWGMEQNGIQTLNSSHVRIKQCKRSLREGIRCHMVMQNGGPNRAEWAAQYGMGNGKWGPGVWGVGEAECWG